VKKHQLQAPQPVERTHLSFHNRLPKILPNFVVLIFKQLIALIAIGDGAVIAVQVMQWQCEALVTKPTVQLFPGAEDIVADQEEAVVGWALLSQQHKVTTLVISMPFSFCLPHQRESLPVETILAVISFL
jgi:hypothetical protein